MTQEICDKAVLQPFMQKFSPNIYRTQEMCDKADDSYLLTVKFVPDWFVMSKMLKKLDNSVFSNDDVFFHDVDSVITFLSSDMACNTIDLILTLMMIFLMKKILKLLFMLDFRLDIIDSSDAKHKEKVSKKLMPVVWHPTRCWDWCLSEDEKKEIESFLIDEK